jgi:site-specific DNA recombinase
VPIEDTGRRDAVGRPVVVAVRREIESAQAQAVRDIFDWYATGYSPRWIADEINRLRVPSPGASWQRQTRRGDGIWLASAIAGDVRKAIGILYNDLYRGVNVWNRSRWIRDPETHRRVRQQRPESEWVVQPVPDLRIVSDELWDRVKARQADVREKSAKIREALHRSARPGRDPKYLRSGLLKCGLCGANFVIGDQRHYVCASHVNGGQHACGNHLRVARVIAESRILAGIKAELLAPEYLEEFERELRTLRAAQRSARRAVGEARRARLSELQQEVGHLDRRHRQGAAIACHRGQT